VKTFWRVYEKIGDAIWVAIALPPLMAIGLLLRVLDAIDEAPFRR
jgi:hypothetical protein